MNNMLIHKLNQQNHSRENQLSSSQNKVESEPPEKSVDIRKKLFSLSNPHGDLIEELGKKFKKNNEHCLALELFEENSAELKDYTCIICTGVYFNPIITPCGHITCDECLRVFYASYQNCPFCRQSILLSNCYSIPFINQILSKKKLRCPNQPCEWKDRLINYVSHLNNDCQHRMVSCQNKGCSKVMLSKDVQSHSTQCDYRIVVCSSCSSKVTFKKLVDHISQVCPKSLVKCPNQCNKEIYRMNLSKHNFECENIEVDCLLSSIGCNFRGKRSEITVHNQICFNTHYMLMYNESQLVDTEINRHIMKIESLLNSVPEIRSNPVIQRTAGPVAGKRKRGRPPKFKGLLKLRGQQLVGRPSHFSHTPYANEPLDRNYSLPLQENSGANNLTKKTTSIREISNENDQEIIIDNEESSGSKEVYDPAKDVITLKNLFLPKYNSKIDSIEACPIKEKNQTFDAKLSTVGLHFPNPQTAVCTEKNDTCHKFALGTPNPIYKNLEFEMKLVTVKGWIGIGLISKYKYQKNEFKFLKDSKGKAFEDHGSFLLSSNGYSWNCNNEQENNVRVKEGALFSSGDTVKIVFDSLMKTLTFKFMTTQEEYKLTNISINNDISLTPCAIFLREGDSVTIS